MRRLEFRESDQQGLNYERYHHPLPWAQQRMEALFGAGKVIRRIEFPTADGDEFKARLALRRVNPLTGRFDG